MSAQTPVERMEAQVYKTPREIYIAAVLALVGISFVIASLILGVVLADRAGEYFSHDAAARDTARVGSDILEKQATLEAYPGWLEIMPFVGIGLVLLGITSLFGGIIPTLRLWAAAMGTVLPAFRDRRIG